jgi:nucleoside-diphosphate-sugar epimerase
MKNIFITGGGGYCGAILIPKLLDKGYNITIYDTFYFGSDHLKPHPNLQLIKGDLRDQIKLRDCLKNQNSVIHLACISNDSSFELNESLSTSINYDAFEPLVIEAKNSGVNRFIYASSSSVYGVSKEKNVKEDHPLVPLTLYNKYKGLCEPILLSEINNDFVGTIFRPATVCGYSPRMRFDLSVNILTNLAIRNSKITVFGGKQLRPNLHIEDYSRVVIQLLESESEKINGEIFNVGSQNLSILEIANLVKVTVPKYIKNINEIAIEISSSDDPRSYHINSDKIKNTLNFSTMFTVEDAIRDICNAFSKNLFEDSLENINYFNVKKVKSLNVE